jgi:hypothetical protein
VLAARVVIGRQVEVHARTIRGGQPNAKLATKASASSHWDTPPVGARRRRGERRQRRRLTA